MRALRRFVSCMLVVIATSKVHNANRPQSNREIDAFNQRFLQLIASTDHGGMLELWANDGVDLMPGDAPLLGKDAISRWLKSIESASPGSRVSTEELQFHDVRLSGDWASEWATEHQIVRPKGKPPVESYGKLALVLHRGTQGSWKIEQEMWNDSPQP